jgi:hypothetical protein
MKNYDAEHVLFIKVYAMSIGEVSLFGRVHQEGAITTHSVGSAFRGVKASAS